jgi:hypothetical protein
MAHGDGASAPAPPLAVVGQLGRCLFRHVNENVLHGLLGPFERLPVDDDDLADQLAQLGCFRLVEHVQPQQNRMVVFERKPERRRSQKVRFAPQPSWRSANSS